MVAAVAAWRPWLAVPLVAIAGYVDAIGWLRLQELFVSFMSGTSTILGIALADGPAGRAAVLALVVGLFVAGAIAGAALGRLAGRWRAAAVLGLVAVLLALAWKLSWLGPRLPPAAYALVPAMGALNLALPGVGGITFVTGALTRFAEALVAALAGVGPHAAWLRQLAAWSPPAPSCAPIRGRCCRRCIAPRRSCTANWASKMRASSASTRIGKRSASSRPNGSASPRTA
jgi:uncharacterized membrane protein YoaK (UPF0700 family)